MENKCKYSESIYKYFNQELDTAQQSGLLKHIEGCKDCKEEFKILELMQENLKGIEDVELPEGYHEELHSKLERSVLLGEQKSNKLFALNRIAAVVAVVIIAVFSVQLYKSVSPILQNNQAITDTAGYQLNGLSELAQDNSMYNNAEVNNFSATADVAPQNRAMTEASNENSKGIAPNDVAQGGQLKETSSNKLKQFKGLMNTKDNTMKNTVANEDTIIEDQVVDMKSSEIKQSSMTDGVKSTTFSSAKVSFEVVIEGEYCSEKEKKSVVIGNEGALKILWRGFGIDSKSFPLIDFNKYTVVAVFAGEKTSSGYGISVESVTDEGEAIIVKVKETSPPDGSIGLCVMTSPFQIVKIESVGKKIEVR